ncbi:MAG TPA: SpvB/TcaC N-terminal domain-containing protein, partial [Candidatus Binatia bacterium]|nr:SpvB/TcaC N-terminal domain-containing protein [Candidatus Binatia bacterium]
MHKTILMVAVLLVVPSLAQAQAPSAAFGNHGSALGNSSGDGSAAFTSVASAAEANLFTGVAGTTIDIVVPPGRDKMTPVVRLVYSSMAGRSPYGYGWSIPTAKISRARKDGVPRYDVATQSYNDTGDFILDLNGSSTELVRIGTSNWFKPKVESGFLQIGYSSGSNFWRLIDRDGTSYTFGGSANGRLGRGTSTFGGTSEWLLTSAQDFNINTIKYTYTSSTAATPAGLPQSIAYGGTATGQPDKYRVEFHWDTTYHGYPSVRPISYAGGYANLSGALLSSITTHVLNDVAGLGPEQPERTVRQYSFVYEIENGSCGNGPCPSGIAKLTAVGLTANGMENSVDDRVEMPDAVFEYSPTMHRGESSTAAAGWTTEQSFFSNGTVPVIQHTLSGDAEDPHRQGRMNDRPGDDNRSKFATMDLNGDAVLDYIDATDDGLVVAVDLRVRFGSLDKRGRPQLATGPGVVWNW